MNDATCYSAGRNTMLRRSNLRSQRMQKNSSEKEKSPKFRLICVFPEKTPDEESVKSDVRSILHMELQHQLQQIG